MFWTIFQKKGLPFRFVLLFFFLSNYVSVNEIKSFPYFVSTHTPFYLLQFFFFSSLIAHICERNNKTSPTDIKQILFFKKKALIFFWSKTCSSLYRQRKYIIKKRIWRLQGISCLHGDNYTFFTSLKKFIFIYKVENISSMICKITKSYPIFVP